MTLPVLLALLACSAKDSDSDVGLPPDDTGVPLGHDTAPWYPDSGEDTDAVVTEPDHTLTLREWGRWDLSPSGGPYDAMTGVLRVQEWVDEDRPYDTSDTGPDTDVPPSDTDRPDLDCDVVYDLAGGPAEGTCTDCTATFAITFVLATGDPTACHDHALPADGGVMTFGYDAKGEQIVYDFGDLGLWVPWWPAAQLADTVRWDASYTRGIALEDTGEGT